MILFYLEIIKNYFHLFQNNINFSCIKKYENDIILPQYLNHKIKRVKEENEKNINNMNINRIGVD